ncbi:MAG: PQQ-like beta-propeller repeat protein, partial [Pseudomonadota bacterium]|nr:PQQ-like beta-propeller repeat protein [Pseudomonadota bacterium]
MTKRFLNALPPCGGRPGREKIYILLTLCVMLGGCSVMPSWLGGKKEEKPKLPGERIAVLPVGAGLEPDATLKTVPFTLPPPAMNADWPQHNGTISAAAGNLAGGGFSIVMNATAGDGNAFESTLVPPPVVAGGTVFVMDAAGTISAHDAGDISKIHWQSPGVSEADDPPILGGGLAFDGGKLYAVSGLGAAAAFDAATGQPIWRKKMDVSFLSAPQVTDGKLFVLTLDNQIYAINATNGDALWNQRGINETTGLMNQVSPTVTGDTVIVPYSSGEVYALAAADGHELWSDSLSPGGGHIGTSALFGGIGGDPVVDGS